MSEYLCLSFRLLDAAFHGRGDGDVPEWPPSPLRAFQAIVAAAGSRCRKDTMFDDYALNPLAWLQGLGSPIIFAPQVESAPTYRLYVPNNHEDIVAAARKGGDHFATIAEHRVEKDVRSTRLIGSDKVHYLWPIAQAQTENVRVLNEIAREVSHLGWGTDQAAASLKILPSSQLVELSGERWCPDERGDVQLRVPQPAGSATPGTLADLRRKHCEFKHRLGQYGFRPVTPLTAFEVVRYHSAAAAGFPPPSRPFVAFELHRTIADQESDENAGKSKFRPFHHVRKVAAVAGMVRHAAATAARHMGWPMEEVQRRILGHGDDKDGQSTSDDRLLFLPLPSIQPVVGVGGIRRVLVAAPPGFDMDALRRQLNGQDLIDRDTCKPVAMLSGIARTDKAVRPFIDSAMTWSTVTPVILPGHDDPDGLWRKLKELQLSNRSTAEQQKNLLERLDSRILALIWKAFHQAGWTPDALMGAEIEYRKVGWFRGLDLAKNYDLPPLKYPRYHVRVRFARAVRGPLAVGAGRYRGMGVFAADNS